jgi:hypothetical protein
MKGQTLVVIMFALLLAIAAFGRDKKHNDRAMIEKMEAVPCGAKERGISGLGSVFASIGATAINSDEKLCPQYVLRTDDMEYHVRPLDHKHPVILPVGKEGEFKIAKDVLEMRIPDGDRKKRRYQVVVMKPIDHAEISDASDTKTKYDARKNYTNQPLDAKTSSVPGSVQGSAVRPPADPVTPPQ